jgi:hypothetical protein
MKSIKSQPLAHFNKLRFIEQYNEMKVSDVRNKLGFFKKNTFFDFQNYDLISAFFNIDKGIEITLYNSEKQTAKMLTIH